MTSPIAVHDLGGSGPDVLYVHATGLHGHCWSPIAERLPHLHNIALDCRGHGDSPLGPDMVDSGPISWKSHAGDVVDVAKSLGTGPVLGVGHSMGGAALLLASLAAPSQFRGLVLYEPVLLPSHRPLGESNQLASGARRRRSSFASFDEAIANYSSKPPLNVYSPEAMEAYVRYGFRLEEDGRVHLKCTPDTEARTFEGAPLADLWDHLDDISVPVWVLCGLPEVGQVSAVSQMVAERIPDARYSELDHLGHFGPQQSPAEIAAIIAEAETSM